MTVKIAKRIVGYKVLEAVPEKAAVAEELERAIESMNENVSRPETLPGATYKLKTPLSEHALYVTINDIVLNPGTAHEQRRDLHQLEEHGPLPVGPGADPRGLGRVPQGR